jgi:hypothetical protein
MSGQSSTQLWTAAQAAYQQALDESQTEEEYLARMEAIYRQLVSDFHALGLTLLNYDAKNGYCVYVPELRWHEKGAGRG